jgi:hypothetical protein
MRCTIDMMDSLSHRPSALKTLVDCISWLDQENLGRELGEEHKEGFHEKPHPQTCTMHDGQSGIENMTRFYRIG